MKRLRNWAELNGEVIGLCQQRRYAEAAILGEQALKVAEASFGASHPNVAQALENLALAYHSQAKYAEALLFEGTFAKKGASVIDRPEFKQFVHNLMLVNLVNQNYSKAETLLKQAVVIKQQIFHGDHPELTSLLGNLADLYNSQGKYSEAESLIKSIRSHSIPTFSNNQLDPPEKSTPDLREAPGRRRHPRLPGPVPAELSSPTLSSPIKGVAVNFSKGGAFIKTTGWRAFKIDDQVAVRILLPSSSPNRKGTIGVGCTARVTRLEQTDEGVAVRFTTAWREMQQSEDLEVAGKSRYKKVAFYLERFKNMVIRDIKEKYPPGFFIVESRSVLDSDVIFQFSTIKIQSPNAEDHLPRSGSQLHILEAKVIEIKKRKASAGPGLITIGRSSENDLVLYNKNVSKIHACLCNVTAGACPYVVDCHSTNNTFLNGTKLTPNELYTLRDGDEISFGPEAKMIYLSAECFHKFLNTLSGCCS